MNNLMNVIDGFKTYICVVIVLLILAARYLHVIDDGATMIGMGVFGSLAVAALRHSNSKVAQLMADLLEKKTGVNPSSNGQSLK